MFVIALLFLQCNSLLFTLPLQPKRKQLLGLPKRYLENTDIVSFTGKLIQLKRLKQLEINVG
ncbi:MAG: hypothetical protein N3A72_09495 [bacterium]|nr:hypothetical protein [bacterium]